MGDEDFPGKENTAWIAGSSLASVEKYHTNKDCHTITDEASIQNDVPLADAENSNDVDPCKHCAGTIDRGSSTGYFSYAKSLRSGELDATDITEPLDTPAAGPRGRGDRSEQ